MTAYEMRISDWSSDVCSSDLEIVASQSKRLSNIVPRRPAATSIARSLYFDDCAPMPPTSSGVKMRWVLTSVPSSGTKTCPLCQNCVDEDSVASASVMLSRSEEHTSELQSLMRIPYAVFC